MNKRFRKFALVGALLLLLGGAALGGYLWADWHYQRARLALAGWDFDAAEHHLDQCAKVWWYPRGAIRHLQARTARLAGKYDEAEAHLRAWGEQGAPAEGLELEYLLLRALQGDFSAVEGRLVHRVLQGHPESAAILEVLAPTYLRTFRLLQAKECVRRWVQLEPDRVQAWMLAAQVYERMQASEDTLASYRRVVELDPDNFPARLTLAGLLTEGHDPKEALSHFEYLQSRQGDTPPILLGLAHCRRLLNQPEEARRLLAQVLAAQPNDGAALAERARLAQVHDSVSEATEWFRQAVAAKPFEKDVVYGYYLCLVRLGKTPEAKEVLAKLKALEGDLARLQDLTAAIVQDPHDPSLRCEAGKILLRSGDALEGLRWMESALREDPQHAATHQALREYYERIGDHEQAARHR